MAIEPNPMVAALLKVNTAEIVGNVEVLQFGLSDAAAELNFKVDGQNLGRSRVTDEPTRAVIKVHCA